MIRRDDPDDVFQLNLFQAHDLDQKQKHSLNLINNPLSSNDRTLGFDVDYAIVTFGDGDPSSVLVLPGQSSLFNPEWQNKLYVVADRRHRLSQHHVRQRLCCEFIKLGYWTVFQQNVSVCTSSALCFFSLSDCLLTWPYVCFSVASKKGAKATIDFYGNAIQIFGAVSADHGTFSLKLDDGDEVTRNASSWKFFPQTLLVCHHYGVCFQDYG